ncbi:hypothetical protein M2138_001297 [Dysgonomonadaceae bacterium PH5-43]|nr:hypothetical protein [Dysgonomonadaceae bacterium PH5-43]
MKIYRYLLLLPMLCLLYSCNNDEGFGGSSTLEGYVYKIVHSDDNFAFATDTFPALDERVFLQYPDDLEDIRTDSAGKYRVNYLRSGTYSAYAISKYADDSQQAEVVKVKVSGSLTVADTIFIHTGKANGTAMIRGSVYATYWHNGKYQGQGPALGERVFIKHAGQDAYFDDIRVSDKGVFIFQKLTPGVYEIHAITTDKDTRVPATIVQTIEITETGIIYDLPKEIEVGDEQYTFHISVI